MTPTKVRVVLDLIRGKKVTEAFEILQLCDRLAAEAVMKCLNSAVANAENNEDIPVDQLYVSRCFADKSLVLKRFRARARGRAGRINKQSSHIFIEVSKYTDDELLEQEKIQELKAKSKPGKSKSKKASVSRADRVAKSKKTDQSDKSDNDVTNDELDNSESDLVDENGAEAEVEDTQNGDEMKDDNEKKESK